jgi:cell division transport system ATP-binding protein
MGLFRRFNEVGVTVVVATHDLSLVQRSGLREIVLDDGRLNAPPSAADAMQGITT